MYISLYTKTHYFKNASKNFLLKKCNFHITKSVFCFRTFIGPKVNARRQKVPC